MSLAMLRLEEDLRLAEDVALGVRTLAEVLVLEVAREFRDCMARRLADGRHALPPYPEKTAARVAEFRRLHRRARKYTSEQNEAHT